MLKVNDETVKKFSESLHAYMKMIRVMPITEFAIALRALVHDAPETAALLVSIYCQRGQINPVYLQGVLLLAKAYYVEFRDYSLIQLVEEEAKLAAAEDSLTKINFLVEGLHA